MPFGPQEILLVVVVGMLLFGAQKLPELARSIGRSVNEFKKGLSNEPQPEEKADKEKEVKPQS